MQVHLGLGEFAQDDLADLSRELEGAQGKALVGPRLDSALNRDESPRYATSRATSTAAASTASTVFSVFSSALA